MPRFSLLALVVAGALTACTGPTPATPEEPAETVSRATAEIDPGESTTLMTSTIKPATIPSPAEAAGQLASLRTTTREPPRVSYSRSAFGDSWIDTDGNGCNQRDDVLLRDGLPGTVLVQPQGACPHDVIAGEWLGPYTGKSLIFDDLKDLSQAQALQIDHVVPLAEAWDSGANAWTEEERRLFANDLGELLASDGPTNASKSDHDPAAWRPTKEFQCEYASRWIGIKADWDLAVDDSERTALVDMLGYCEG